MMQKLITKRELDKSIKSGKIMLAFNMKYNPNILPPRGVMEVSDKESQEILMNALLDQELWIEYRMVADPVKDIMDNEAYNCIKDLMLVFKVKKLREGCYDKL